MINFVMMMPSCHVSLCKTLNTLSTIRKSSSINPSVSSHHSKSIHSHSTHTFSCFHTRRSPSRSPTTTIIPHAIDPDALTDRDIPIARLQQQLDEAIDNEDYDNAAQLRDEIQRRRFDNRLAVEEANDAFYAAFTSGSLKDMSIIWGKGEHVQCIHPAAGCIAGRQNVLDSWKLVLGSGRMKITLDDVRVYATEHTGYVTCIELVDAGDSVGRIMATNVFEKQDGKWKIVHHHGSPLPRSIV